MMAPSADPLLSSPLEGDADSEGHCILCSTSADDLVEAMALPPTCLTTMQKLTDDHEISLNGDSIRALQHVSLGEAERVLERTLELAEEGRLFSADGFIVSTCWRQARDVRCHSSQEKDTTAESSSYAHSSRSTSSHHSATDEDTLVPAALIAGTESRHEELQNEQPAWADRASKVSDDSHKLPCSAPMEHQQSIVASTASTEDWHDSSRSRVSSTWSSDSFSGLPTSSLFNNCTSLGGVVASNGGRSGPRMHLGVADQPLIDRQARFLRQAQRDACVWAYIYLLKALCWFGMAVLICVVSIWFFIRTSSSGDSGSYMLSYIVIWVPLGIVTYVFKWVRESFMEAFEYWHQATRTHIVLRSNENFAEFKAVGRYLEDCGVMTSNARLQIAQDEDDVEEVHLNWSPWARSFLKYACVHGISGEASSIEFRTFCPGRWLPCLCRSNHGHFEVHYEKARDDSWEGSTYRGANRFGGDRSHDTIVISVPDHQAEYIENFFLHAHMNYTTPRSTRVEVYSAAPGGEPGAGGASSPAWEFMQYIPPMAQERTGRFTYVPGPAFTMIEEEYRRVVSIGNESLTVLVTGASRAGKSALVNALAHRLGLPIYNLNLKAKYLIDGGIDSLFSYRAIKHRPVLVHIEEFAMMFQETLLPPDTGEAGQRYEGLQQISSLHCSDLLKLFDQSGTTSPKRIFFVLTCIELPEQFDRIRELQPLLARGRIQHFRMEEPTEEVISQFMLQYFYPEPKRPILSAADRAKLVGYVDIMKQRLGQDYRNWHAIVKYAEEIPI